MTKAPQGAFFLPTLFFPILADRTQETAPLHPELWHVVVAVQTH